MGKGIALRAASITMGFVFFMGGWRRFINAPAKHDIESAAHLANKLVAAAPGSPIESIIHWLLGSPFLTQWSVYFMSTAEILLGLGLIFGFFTRLAAAGSAALNVALMLIFGWMGYECLDEWTMAALGFSVCISVMIFGPGNFSLDHFFGRDDFASIFKPYTSMILVTVSVIFTVGFYSYYFGIFTLDKRTSVAEFSIVALPVPERTDIKRFYVEEGPSAKAAYIQSITFSLENGEVKKQAADQIPVIESLFEPWSGGSGTLIDGLIKLRLGSMVDIRIPEKAERAHIDIIDNKNIQLKF